MHKVSPAQGRGVAERGGEGRGGEGRGGEGELVFTHKASPDLPPPLPSPPSNTSICVVQCASLKRA